MPNKAILLTDLDLEEKKIVTWCAWRLEYCQTQSTNTKPILTHCTQDMTCMCEREAIGVVALITDLETYTLLKFVASLSICPVTLVTGHARRGKKRASKLPVKKKVHAL